MTEPRNKVVQVRRFGDPDGLLCAYGYIAGVQAASPGHAIECGIGVGREGLGFRSRSVAKANGEPRARRRPSAAAQF